MPKLPWVFSPAKNLRQGSSTHEDFGCRSLKRAGSPRLRNGDHPVVLPQKCKRLCVCSRCLQELPPKRLFLGGLPQGEITAPFITPSRASLVRGRAVSVGNVVGSMRFRVLTRRCSGSLYPNMRKPRLGLL